MIQWPVRATTDSGMLSQQVRASVITHFLEVSHETEPLYIYIFIVNFFQLNFVENILLSLFGVIESPFAES